MPIFFLFVEKAFRQNLRDELDYQDLTVKELSEKAAIAKGALDCYLGKQASMPPADAAVRIAAALGVSVEYLVTGKDPSKEKSVFSFHPRIRSLLQIANELNKKDQEILLDLAKSFKNHA